ncbi:MAG: hypothetical protein KatS3mg060_3299 [Dehalococcoidia bacterium]|nr:MAG: hypothetical protein KatS3mg060_3299 [Dehalococcoidia bacterium]
MIRARRARVLVVGSGAAGVAAALAAARNGADTLLVESQGFVGGNSAILPWLGFHSRDYRLVVRGIALELAERLRAIGAASPIVLDPVCSSAMSLDGHRYKVLALELLGEAGARVMLQTHVVDVIRERDRIAGVVVEHKSGREVIEADVVIDCSGDGDVAARGGVPWEKGRSGDGLIQAPTLVFRVGGVDREAFVRGAQRLGGRFREMLAPYPDALTKFLARLPDQPVIIVGGYHHLMEEARRAGDLDVPPSRVVGVKPHQPDQFIAVTTKVVAFDPTDVDVLTRAYLDAYAQIPPLLRFFRTYLPGFEHSYLLEIAPMIGTRESRRILGDYVLTGEDVMAGRVFPDVVAMGGYHIDIHQPDGRWVESRNVQPYDIPFRSLVARGRGELADGGQVHFRHPRGDREHASDPHLYGRGAGSRDGCGTGGGVGEEPARRAH